jgi:hypothetical protein
MSDQSPAAGWYPAPHANNEQRYWDGAQWLDPAPAGKAPGRLQSMATKMTSQHDASSDPDAIWAAVGKPMTGLGVGRYKLTAEFLFFEKGTISTKSQQIRTADIYDVDAAQSMAQKARGLGTIKLYAQRGATGEREEVLLEDVPNFREGVSAINNAAFAAREGQRVRENTQHVSYAGGSAPHPGFMAASQHEPVVAASHPAVDLNAELAKLGALKAQGILDDEEFTAAKRKLLGLT